MQYARNTAFSARHLKQQHDSSRAVVGVDGRHRHALQQQRLTQLQHLHLRRAQAPVVRQQPRADRRAVNGGRKVAPQADGVVAVAVREEVGGAARARERKAIHDEGGACVGTCSSAAWSEDQHLILKLIPASAVSPGRPGTHACTSKAASRRMQAAPAAAGLTKTWLLVVADGKQLNRQATCMMCVAAVPPGTCAAQAAAGVLLTWDPLDVLHLCRHVSSSTRLTLPVAALLVAKHAPVKLPHSKPSVHCTSTADLGPRLSTLALCTYVLLPAALASLLAVLLLPSWLYYCSSSSYNTVHYTLQL